jgi:hypothetical protein
MVELQRYRLAQQRLAIECHAEACRLQHRKVIRAIANTGCRLPADPKRRALSVEELQF